ncbi:TonB-dependent receptor [Sabulilitoribacter arenilitoris]|uniref:TonB-dependent receptor n=1 Tax=Wocania arenilitoris TaxID=2044858 RepID=A0AAE3ENP8_9FLAO|nr:TonB-dependent receptor [Wocania arenilitoris]MCF7568233.1 TonB-dependent receptor [Wocania arenilitoris]
MIIKLCFTKANHNINRLLGLLLLCFFVFNTNVSANNKEYFNTAEELQQQISGTVIDKDGVPLAGTNVVVKGTSRGTQTDFDGNYTIDASKGEVLEFSYVGMLAQTITIGDNTTINVTMQEDAAQLDEVVVVGYGTQKRATLAGAVATISADQFQSRPITNVATVLQGTIPGLVVTQVDNQPGAESFGFQIRGASSINGSAPLVLVDGIQSSLDRLNPDDIESMSIVKDGAASIYGNQASGGVILVTTKKGKKNSKPQFNYTSTYGFNRPTYLPEKTNMSQYMEIVNQAWMNAGNQPVYGDNFFNALGTNTILNFADTNLGGAVREDSYLIFNQPENAFVDQFFEDGVRQNHNLSITGGGENSTYRFSLGYFNEDGLLNTKFDNYERYNIRLNNTFDLSDKFRVTLQNAVEIGDRSRNTQDFAAIGRLQTNWTFAPIRNPQGEYYTFRGFNNALDLLEQGSENRLKQHRFISNIKADLELIDGLTLTGQAGINYLTTKSRTEVTTITLNKAWSPGVVNGNTFSNTTPERLLRDDNTASGFTLNGYFTYEKTIADDHNFKLVGGGSHEEFRSDNLSTQAWLLVNGFFSPNVADDEEDRIGAGGSRWTLRSAFGRFNYDYKGKYILESNLRYDGSSRFNADNRWGLFYSGLAAWRASEEQFVKDLNIFDNLKFRFSYGETGNQSGIGLHDYLALVGSGTGALIGKPAGTGGVGNISAFGVQQILQVYAESNIVSLDRSWETVQTTNYAVDMSFLDNRLGLTFEYFKRVNKDMLVPLDLPTVLGGTAPSLNAGELETKGFEVEVNWRDNIGDLNYFVRGVLFNDTNRLVELQAASGVVRSGINNRLVGESLGTYFGWDFDGIFQTQAEVDAYRADVTAGLPAIGVGDARYVDRDGNGRLEAVNEETGGDLIKLGNIRPQYSFSFDVGGDYKNFDFRMLWQGVGKRTLFKSGGFSAPFQSGSWWNQGLKYWYGKIWTPDNTGARYPRVHTNAGIANYNYRPSINNKLNGAYARLKNLQIGYSLPSDVLSKLDIDKIRLFVSGENILEIQSRESRELGFDPEQGTGSSAYPFTRNFSFGAQITF